MRALALLILAATPSFAVEPSFTPVEFEFSQKVSATQQWFASLLVLEQYHHLERGEVSRDCELLGQGLSTKVDLCCREPEAAACQRVPSNFQPLREVWAELGGSPLEVPVPKTPGELADLLRRNGPGIAQCHQVFVVVRGVAPFAVPRRVADGGWETPAEKNVALVLTYDGRTTTGRPKTYEQFVTDCQGLFFQEPKEPAAASTAAALPAFERPPNLCVAVGWLGDQLPSFSALTGKERTAPSKTERLFDARLVLPSAKSCTVKVTYGSRRGLYECALESPCEGLNERMRGLAKTLQDCSSGAFDHPSVVSQEQSEGADHALTVRSDSIRFDLAWDTEGCRARLRAEGTSPYAK